MISQFYSLYRDSRKSKTPEFYSTMHQLVSNASFFILAYVTNFAKLSDYDQRDANTEVATLLMAIMEVVVNSSERDPNFVMDIKDVLLMIVNYILSQREKAEAIRQGGGDPAPTIELSFN